MKSKVKVLFTAILVLSVYSCAPFKETSSYGIQNFLMDWQESTYSYLADHFFEITTSDADSLSIVNYSMPIFKNHIIDSRSEVLSEFDKVGINPFKNALTSEYLIIEIFREDNCHTKVMHIINLSAKKENNKQSFIRNCETQNQSIIYEDRLPTTILKFTDKFIANFNYKAGFRSYTGIVTLIEKGKFKSIPLLYLSDDEIVIFNKQKIGLY